MHYREKEKHKRKIGQKSIKKNDFNITFLHRILQRHNEAKLMYLPLPKRYKNAKSRVFFIWLSYTRLISFSCIHRFHSMFFVKWKIINIILMHNERYIVFFFFAFPSFNVFNSSRWSVCSASATRKKNTHRKKGTNKWKKKKKNKVRMQNRREEDLLLLTSWIDEHVAWR